MIEWSRAGAVAVVEISRGTAEGQEMRQEARRRSSGAEVHPRRQDAPRATQSANGGKDAAEVDRDTHRRWGLSHALHRGAGAAHAAESGAGLPSHHHTLTAPPDAPQATQGGRSSAGVEQGMAHRQSHAEGTQSRHRARQGHRVGADTIE